MKGRARYRLTFRVREYWTNPSGREVTLYDLSAATDCMSRGYEEGKEYLVFADLQPARDYKDGDFFWYGWTDIVPEGTSILQPTPCTPGGETNDEQVRVELRALGSGKKPRTTRK
jgi:hypothetical protein